MGSFAVSALGLFLALALVAADGGHSGVRQGLRGAKHGSASSSRSVELQGQTNSKFSHGQGPVSGIGILAGLAIEGHLGGLNQQLGGGAGGSHPGAGHGGHITKALDRSKHPLGFDLDGDVLESFGSGGDDKLKHLSVQDISQLGAGVHHGVIEGDIDDLSSLGEVISTKTYNRGVGKGFIKHTIIDGGFIDEEPEQFIHDNAALSGFRGQIHGGGGDSSDYDDDSRSSQIDDSRNFGGVSGSKLSAGFGSSHGLSGSNLGGSGFGSGHRLSGSKLSSSGFGSGQSALGGKLSGSGFGSGHSALGGKVSSASFGSSHGLSSGKFGGSRFGSGHGSSGGKVKSPLRAGHSISSTKFGSSLGGSHGALGSKVGGSRFIKGHSGLGGKISSSNFGSGHGLSSGTFGASSFRGSSGLSGSKSSGVRLGHGHRLTSGKNSGRGHGSSHRLSSFKHSGPVSSSFSSSNIGAPFSHSKLRGKGFSPVFSSSSSLFGGKGSSVHGSGLSAGKNSGLSHGHSGFSDFSGFKSGISSDKFSGGSSAGKFSLGSSLTRLPGEKFRPLKSHGLSSSSKFSSGSFGGRFSPKSHLGELSGSLGFTGGSSSASVHGHNFKKIPTIVKGQGIRILNDKQNGFGNVHGSSAGIGFHDSFGGDYTEGSFGGFSGIGEFNGGHDDFGGFLGKFSTDDGSTFGGFGSFGDDSFKGFGSSFGSEKGSIFGRQLHDQLSSFSNEFGAHEGFGTSKITKGINTAGSFVSRGHGSEDHASQFKGSDLVSHRPGNPYGSTDTNKHHG